MNELSRIQELETKLEEVFPEERFSSKVSLWNKGLNGHYVTQMDYESARRYYGTLWNYTGD